MYALEALGRADFQEAVRQSDLALAKRPADTLAAMTGAAGRYWLGERTKAKAQMAAVAAGDAGNVTARLWLTAFGLMEGDAAGVRARMQELSGMAPNDVRVMILKSCVELAACQAESAREDAFAASQHPLVSPGEGLRLAQLFSLLHRPAAARLSLEQCLEIDPRLAAALVDLGAVFYRQGRVDLAQNAFRQALELDKDEPKARLYLRYALSQRVSEHEAANRPDQALLALRELAALVPQDASVQARLRALSTQLKSSPQAP